MHNMHESLAHSIDQLSELCPPMKQSVRPLLSILLLIAFAATLSCRAIVRGGISPTELESRAELRVFNATLLKYAETDIGLEREKKEIDDLLEGRFSSPGRYRTFSTWRRIDRHDLRTRTSRGVLVMLRSPSFYRHWLEFRRVLGDWIMRKRFDPKVVMDLVRLVKGPIDRNNGVRMDLDRKYSSCAVVGNSGILLKTEYGEMIDSHEAVIRLNNARVESYRSKVGSKTSISFVNSNILHLCARKDGCFCHPYGVNVPIVMYICQPQHFMDYSVCNSSHKAPLIVTDPRFDILCMRIVKYYSLKRFTEETGKPMKEWGSTHEGSMFHYSSGMQAVMLALGICDRVSLFGFGKSAAAKHHYHTNQKAELKLHDYEAEYNFYQDLVKRPQVIPFLPEKFNFPPVKIYR